MLAAALLTTVALSPLGESPLRRVPEGARCLAPTGALGEVAYTTRGGVAVGDARVSLGAISGCHRAAADASGAAVVAGATDRALRVALREPGAAGFGAPVTLAAARDVFALSVSVSPRGDAVVAWAEWDYDGPRVRIRMARRAAGGAFGAPEDVLPWQRSQSGRVLTAMAADGESVVVAGTGGGPELLRRGGPDVPPIPLPDGFFPLALAAAPDGTFVLAGTGRGGVEVHDLPRGGGLSAPQRVTDESGQVALAIGPDGRAVVAWHDSGPGTTGAAIREAGGAFGPAVEIVAPPALPPTYGASAGTPIVRPLPDLRAAVGPDGRVSVAWQEDGDAHLATLAGGRVVERWRRGSRLRAARGVSLLLLADGRRALAWTTQDGYPEEGPARVHLAVEGVPDAPGRPAPRFSVGAPRETALRPAQPLRLPVRCRAACDLTVTSGRSSAEASLPRAGTVQVAFASGLELGGGPARVVVRASAPGGRAVRRAVVTPRLRRLPSLPLPRIEAVRTRPLGGDRLEVRVRVSGDARETYVSAIATRSRRATRDPRPVLDARLGTARRHYRLVLEGVAGKRWLEVEVSALGSDRRRVRTLPLPNR